MLNTVPVMLGIDNLVKLDSIGIPISAPARPDVDENTPCGFYNDDGSYDIHTMCTSAGGMDTESATRKAGH